MLGAFVNQKHFPLPGLLTCSVGATCDDFSAIARRLETLGFLIHWWEIPHRRRADVTEPSVELPGGFCAPASQVAFVKAELERIRGALEDFAGERLTDERLAGGICRANRVRGVLDELRAMAYRADPCPMPALEMLLSEMLVIHYCSDDNETTAVLSEMRQEAERRVLGGVGIASADAVRVFWVNPVADLQVMNLLEDAGGRIAGTDYLFCHALDPIPTDLPPMEALARSALADPMVGSARDRAARIIADIRRFRAEALVLSRIPGASHCAMESLVIGEVVRSELDIPIVEIEVPSITDSMSPTLQTRLEALIETARALRAGRGR
jgi:benzoyl-CoA reductase/2-hydroxyglutaryl-CoA dehydratase subunit BcrC/BadD/HgdB